DLNLGPSTVTVYGGSTSYAGNLSGAGRLVLQSNTFTLTGTNTQAGGTTINSGTLLVPSDAALGAAGVPLVMSSATLQPTAAMTVARPIQLTFNSTINTNGFNLGAAGPISGLFGLTKS